MDNQQQQFLQLQMLEQEANQLGEQLKIIAQNIQDMAVLKKDVSELEKAGEKEMFAELGKGIFIKGKLTKGSLLVDVGSKLYVPKTHKEVIEIVDDQVKKLGEAELEIGKQVEKINAELNKAVGGMQGGAGCCAEGHDGECCGEHGDECCEKDSKKKSSVEVKKK